MYRDIGPETQRKKYIAAYLQKMHLSKTVHLTITSGQFKVYRPFLCSVIYYPGSIMLPSLFSQSTAPFIPFLSCLCKLWLLLLGGLKPDSSRQDPATISQTHTRRQQGAVTSVTP